MASVNRIEQFATGGGERPKRTRPDSASPDRAAHPGIHEILFDFQYRADSADAGSINRLIESEIIPRLLVAHAAVSPPLPTPLPMRIKGADSVSPAEVAAFAPLALQVEADELLDHVERIVARGVSLDTVLVDLLAPAARQLGIYWEEDRCDFIDVTMGLWRLQEVVHELSGRVLPDLRSDPHAGRPHERRALFASLAGDQHSFGTVVIDELFSANGWLTDRLAEATNEDLLDRVRDDWFDLVGLTITCDCHIATLSSVVRAIRASSRNLRICVMVGGRVFAENADLAAAIGADGTAPDAKIAVRVAGELVDAVAREVVSSMTG